MVSQASGGHSAGGGRVAEVSCAGAGGVAQASWPTAHAVPQALANREAVCRGVFASMLSFGVVASATGAGVNASSGAALWLPSCSWPGVVTLEVEAEWGRAIIRASRL